MYPRKRECQIRKLEVQQNGESLQSFCAGSQEGSSSQKSSNHQQRIACELWYGGQTGQSEGGRDQRTLKMESKLRPEIQNEFDGKRNRTGPALLDFGLSNQSNPELT